MPDSKQMFGKSSGDTPNFFFTFQSKFFGWILLLLWKFYFRWWHFYHPDMNKLGSCRLIHSVLIDRIFLWSLYAVSFIGIIQKVCEKIKFLSKKFENHCLIKVILNHSVSFQIKRNIPLKLIIRIEACMKIIIQDVQRIIYTAKFVYRWSNTYKGRNY